MAKRFKDKNYLDHMTEREIEQWMELRSQIQKIHNRTFLALISNYANHRKNTELELEGQRQKRNHINHMKSLPIGTQVLVIRGEKKAEIGSIYKHGRKYIRVKFDDDDRWIWRLPYTWVTDDFDDEKIEREKRDKAMSDRLAPIFNQVLSEMQD